MTTAQRYVAVAEIARPHGIRGELKLKLYNVDSDLLASRPPIRLAMPDGTIRQAEIRALRPTPGAMLMRLAGVADRNAAEALRGAQIEVARSRFEALGADSAERLEGGDDTAEPEFYVCDLEGCTVLLEGAAVGLVKTVTRYPTCDVLVVTRPAARTLEVPMQAAYIGDVDLEARTVVLLTVEGLQ